MEPTKAAAAATTPVLARTPEALLAAEAPVGLAEAEEEWALPELEA